MNINILNQNYLNKLIFLVKKNLIISMNFYKNKTIHDSSVQCPFNHQCKQWISYFMRVSSTPTCLSI